MHILVPFAPVAVGAVPLSEGITEEAFREGTSLPAQLHLLGAPTNTVLINWSGAMAVQADWRASVLAVGAMLFGAACGAQPATSHMTGPGT